MLMTLTSSMSTTTEPEWWHLAHCTDVDTRLFFRDSNEEPAKALCERCPVREPCLRHALAHNEHGVWGGLNRKERRQIRKQQRKQNALATLG